MTRQLVRMVVGSHLYGTSFPDSGWDFRGVFLPDARDVLLQRVPDTDSAGVGNESFSLSNYLNLVTRGHIGAVEMLFVPPEFVRETSPEWQELIRNRDRLVGRSNGSSLHYLSRKVERYCRSRGLDTAVAVLEMLELSVESGDGESSLNILYRDLLALSSSHPGLSVGEYLGVGGLRAPWRQKIAPTRDCLARLVDSLRIKMPTMENVKWSDLSHAIRVAGEAQELLTTGTMTLPLASDLLRRTLEVKQGLRSLEVAAKYLAESVDRVTDALQSSTLPEHPDQAWIDDFLVRCHALLVVEQTSDCIAAQPRIEREAVE